MEKFSVNVWFPLAEFVLRISEACPEELKLTFPPDVSERFCNVVLPEAATVFVSVSTEEVPLEWMVWVFLLTVPKPSAVRRSDPPLAA